MNIHEYQAKDLLRRFGIPVPRGRAALTPQEVRAIQGAWRILCCQSADPRRGKGKGRRGQACWKPGGSRENSRGDAGEKTGDTPDRPAGAAGKMSLGGRKAEY